LYTGLRVALLVAVWLLVQAITPLRGLFAIAVAIVISGVISFILLDRSRDRASVGVAGVFKRIDDRIERSRTAEDVDDPPPASDSGQGQPETQQESVRQDEQSGALQDRDEPGSRSTPRDLGQGPHGQGTGTERDPGPGEA
jgi:hypothetical protein